MRKENSTSRRQARRQAGCTGLHEFFLLSINALVLLFFSPLRCMWTSTYTLHTTLVYCY